MLIIVILIIGIPPQIFADDELPYLRMGLGARALAMGSAFTAISDNITATYWNPAGLANIDYIELGSMYSANMGVDRIYNYFGIAKKFEFGTIAFSWINAGLKDIPGDQGDYDIMDNNVIISYGRRLFEELKIGMNCKAYFNTFTGGVNDTESGFGFDAGIIYSLHPKLNVGFMIRDIASTTGEDDVPYQGNLGLAVRPFDSNEFLKGITLSGDMRKVKDESKIITGLGLEYALDMKTLTNFDANTAVRLGVNDGHFTTGLGILFKMLEFNYAFTTDTSEDEIFENSHRLSLLLKFLR